MSRENETIFLDVVRSCDFSKKKELYRTRVHNIHTVCMCTAHTYSTLHYSNGNIEGD